MFSGGMAFAGFSMILFLVYLGFLGLSAYMMVMMIKLAYKGMQALDVYINKNQSVE